MSLQEEKRRTLLSRLSRGIAYTAPALALVAGGAAFQAIALDVSGDQGYQMLAMAEGEHEAEGEGEAEGEDEAEGE